MERLLKTLEVAERMGLSPVTVKKWRGINFGPPWKRLRGPRGEIRYPESKFEEWMNEDLNQSYAEELSKRPLEAPEGWNELTGGDRIPEVFDQRLGKRVRRRKES